MSLVFQRNSHQLHSTGGKVHLWINESDCVVEFSAWGAETDVPCFVFGRYSVYGVGSSPLKIFNHQCDFFDPLFTQSVLFYGEHGGQDVAVRCAFRLEANESKIRLSCRGVSQMHGSVEFQVDGDLDFLGIIVKANSLEEAVTRYGRFFLDSKSVNFIEELSAPNGPQFVLKKLV